jgi:hypothetical protein
VMNSGNVAAARFGRQDGAFRPGSATIAADLRPQRWQVQREAETHLGIAGDGLTISATRAALAAETAGSITVASVAGADDGHARRTAGCPAKTMQPDREDLIGFMLGDFRERSAAGQAQLLKNVGTVRRPIFMLSERDHRRIVAAARASARRSRCAPSLEFGPPVSVRVADPRREPSQRSPDNQDWLFALGNAWFWVGYTHWQKGDLTQRSRRWRIS